MKNYQLIIFDLDGTLVKDQTTEPLPGVVEKLRSLDCHVAVATNQGKARWVLRMYGHEIAARVKDAIRNTANCLISEISYAYQYEDGTWSPDSPGVRFDEYAWYNRKPYPGMLFNLMNWYDVKPKDTLFVGDMGTDKLAAQNAGCDFMWAKDFFGWED